MPSSTQKILNFEIHGEGKTVVLLHGFLESNMMWNYVPLQQLAAKFICIELPGHGKSSNSVGSPSIKNMAKRVLTTLEHISINQFSVLGHSMGGYVALELKKMSKKVDTVVLMNSNYWADSKQKAEDRLRIAGFVFEKKNHFLSEAIPGLFLNKEDFKSEIKRLIDEAKEITPEAIAYSSIAMARRTRNYQLLVNNLDSFFIIQGDQDPVAPKALWNSKIVHDNPNYFEIENCGHMAHIEKSKELFSILENILTKI